MPEEKPKTGRLVKGRQKLRPKRKNDPGNSPEKDAERHEPPPLKGLQGNLDKYSGGASFPSA